MFCDLVDSTRLGCEFDIEDLQALLQRLRRLCSEQVMRFDGVVTQFLGDGILACFGFPTAHEDDAERAVRAALALLHEVAAQRVREELPLQVRIGIATGLVVTADDARGRAALLAMVGEPLAMAARLQALAPPDGIVVGPLTRELVGELFEMEDLGERPLKGFGRAVRAWRVVRERRGIDRFSRRSALGLLPFVGREQEQGTLARLWRSVRGGVGQAAVLAGEPGIGKSRTVAAFTSSLERGTYSRVRYFCLPYFRDTPFYPAVEHLERAAGVEPQHSAVEKRNRVAALLAAFGIRDEAALSLCGRVMGFGNGRNSAGEIVPPAQQREGFHRLLLSLLRSLAEQSPLVMTVEDAHWMDSSTAEFLARVVDVLPTMPVLLLVTTRPEFTPPWLDEPHVVSLPLNRLDHRRVRELVTGCAGMGNLPAAIIEEIATKSDGVPLFVEELVRHLLARGREGTPSTAAEKVPDTLRDLLMARVDALGRWRLVVQAGAILGRRFRFDVLARLLPLADSELREALMRLREAGIVVMHGDPPEAACVFRHVLVQEVARDSLLRHDRQALHRRAGEILEQDFPELASQSPELLAMHFREAGVPERAVPWHLAAGDLALSRYDRAQARAQYEAAYEIVLALPSSPEGDGLRTRATLALAAVAADRSEVLLDLQRLADAASRCTDDRTRALLDYWTARLRYVLGEFEEAQRTAAESLTLARRADSGEELVANPVNLLARLACLRGRGREAVDYARENIGQMQRLGNRIEETAITGVLGFGLALCGRFEEAAEAADRGVAMAKDLGHLPTLAAAHCYRGVVHAWREESGRFGEDFAAALDIAERTGDRLRSYLAYGWRGQGHLLAQEFDAARADLEAASALAEEIGTTFHLAAFEAFRAKLELLRGRTREAAVLAERAEALAERTRQPWALSIALRIRSEILVLQPGEASQQAVRLAERAIAVQEESECRYDLAWSHLARGRALAACGRSGEARAALDVAADMFAGMGIARGIQRTAEARALHH